MILLIDNFDSFTFNLHQALAGIVGSKENVKVVRNNAITIPEIIALNPTHIVISPGPCTPNEAGVSINVAHQLAGKFPILGVCLGHQSIAQAFGGKIIRAKSVMHGKTSRIIHNEKGVFSKIPNPFTATRYHSLIVERTSLPEHLIITAETEDGVIMALEHRDYPNLVGLQFHPESILTSVGNSLLSAFVNLPFTLSN